MWIGIWIWKKDWSIGFLVGYLFLILAETVLIRSSGELRYELVPFWSWAEVFKKWPMTYSGKMYFQQILLNIVMFIPIGAILGRRSGWKAIPNSACISLLIEITQLLTRRGLFEFDDVIHNTAGAAIGFGIYTLWKRVKRMTFEELWTRVQGLPDTAMLQVPATLKEDTKRKLTRKMPEEVGRIVLAAIEEVNHGSIEPLDKLIRKRL